MTAFGEITKKKSRNMCILLLKINEFVLNMTGFVLEILRFVLSMAWLILNITVFLLQKTEFIQQQRNDGAGPIDRTPSTD